LFVPLAAVSAVTSNVIRQIQTYTFKTDRAGNAIRNAIRDDFQYIQYISSDSLY
jgi:phage gp36-like protein